MLLTVLIGTFLFSLASAIPKDYVVPKLKDGGQHWAVLVAGSNGWMNYRHQADVCHAYHVMKNHGIPDERIIVMMVDDIAHNRENPFPGEIINQPKGHDVYKGVPIDYKGTMNVVPDVFLKVLKGEKKGMKIHGSGRVLESGPNDHVFLNFVDHGAPGLIAFGSKFLHGKDLMKVLKDMHKEQKYDKMLIYLETCESGSMFKTLLPKDLSILAVTAANASQSSYACYFDKKRKTYLGDLFSVNWMQDSDKEDLSTETIEKQYKIVRHETNKSHVMQYGDMTIGDMTVSEFQGSAKLNHKIPAIPNPNDDAVPSEDVELAVYQQMSEIADTEAERNYYNDKYNEEQLKRSNAVNLIRKIVSAATNNNNRQTDLIMYGEFDLYRTDCYKEVVEYAADLCGPLDLRNQFGYAMKHLYAFINLCEMSIPTETIMESILKMCE